MSTDRRRLIAAHTRMLSAPAESRYDAVSYEVVRQGAVEMSGDRFPTMRLRRGSLVARPPGVRGHASPSDGGAEISVLLVDPDLLIDTLAWQYAHEYQAGHAGAAAILRAHCTEPAYGARIAEPAMLRLEPALDGLVALSDEEPGRNFHRETALLFQVLGEMIPALEDELVTTASPDGIRKGPSPRPVRAEVALVARLIESDLARPWTTVELATEAGLSANQLRRVFTATFGHTPQRYQTLMRVQRLVELLHDPRLKVSEAILRAGWATPDNGARRFRQATGMSPRAYRRRAHSNRPQAVTAPATSSAHR